MKAKSSLVLAALLSFSGLALGDGLFIDVDIDRHARTWLQRMDEGGPGAAWDASSELMKGGMSKADWEKAFKPVENFGAVRTRTPTSAVFSVKLGGMPDGRYAVINYDTVFTGKEKAVESVILRHEADGLWRGVGYRVQ